MKKKLYRSIDAPWMQDDPVDMQRVLEERWQPGFADDECGWWPIRPTPANPGAVIPPGGFSPPQCSTCGFKYAYGDARLHQKCHCDVKVIKKTALTMVAMVIIGLAAVAAVIWWRMPHL